jgi:hypothetical protein
VRNFATVKFSQDRDSKWGRLSGFRLETFRSLLVPTPIEITRILLAWAVFFFCPHVYFFPYPVDFHILGSNFFFKQPKRRINFFMLIVIDLLSILPLGRPRNSVGSFASVKHGGVITLHIPTPGLVWNERNTREYSETQ